MRCSRADGEPGPRPIGPMSKTCGWHCAYRRPGRGIGAPHVTAWIRFLGGHRDRHRPGAMVRCRTKTRSITCNTRMPSALSAGSQRRRTRPDPGYKPPRNCLTTTRRVAAHPRRIPRGCSETAAPRGKCGTGSTAATWKTWAATITALRLVPSVAAKRRQLQRPVPPRASVVPGHPSGHRLRLENHRRHRTGANVSELPHLAPRGRAILLAMKLRGLYRRNSTDAAPGPGVRGPLFVNETTFPRCRETAAP